MSDDFVFATVSQSPSPTMDVVFIHGLMGDPISTWTSDSKEGDGTYWPKWVAKDVPGASVYTLGYPASLFGRWAIKEMELFERAIASLDYLASYDIGTRPIAFVAHSLGGLLTKQMLRTSLDADDEGWAAIAKSCRLVAFLATPHTGSSLASILNFIVPQIVSNHVEMLKGGDRLDELNFGYKKVVRDLQIDTVAFYEMHKTAKLAFTVAKKDADDGTARQVIPVDADHVNICKPVDRNHPVYRGIYRRIKSLAKKGQPVARAVEAVSKDNREQGLVQAALNTFVQGWLAEQMTGQTSAGVGDRISKGLFDDLDGARRKALLGKWEGQATQTQGPDGGPIEYSVFLDIKSRNGAVTGEYRFVWNKAGVIMVDETLPIEGGFFDSFLLLNFKDTISGKMQFGSLLLELSDDARTLRGVDVGVGYTTRKIVMGNVTFQKR